MNKNKMFIVSNMVFKIVDSKQISTSISQIKVLKEISNYNDFLSHPLLSTQFKLSLNLKVKQYEQIEKVHTASSGQFRTKVLLQTENYWASFPSRTEIETEFTISNYKKAWIGYALERQNTEYEIELISYDEVSGKWGYNYGQSKSQQIRSYNKTEKFKVDDEWTNKYNPRFWEINGYVITPAGNIDLSTL